MYKNLESWKSNSICWSKKDGINLYKYFEGSFVELSQATSQRLL